MEQEMMSTTRRYMQHMHDDVLDGDATRDLARRAQAGDHAAAARLITGNLRLVVHIAKRYSTFADIDDLIQEGSMGLMHAVMKYDLNQTTKFSTYAVWWIRQRMFRWMNRNKIIALPYDVQKKVAKIRKFQRAYIEAHGDMPSYVTIAAAVNVSVDDIRWLVAMSDEVLSLDRLVANDDGEGYTLNDIIAAPATYLVVDPDDDDLRQALALLNSRERQIVTLWYGLGTEPLSLVDISKQFCCTGACIHQIKKRAVEKLRKYLDEKRHIS